MVVALFYAADLYVVAPSLAGVLRMGPRGRFRWTVAQDRSVQVRGGLHLLWTSWLPMRPTLIAELPPVRLDAEGVWLLPPGILPPDPRIGPPEHLPYETLGPVRAEGARLRLGGRAVRFASPLAARLTADRIAELVGLRPAERVARTREDLARTLDVDEVRRRVRAFRRAVRPLRLSATLLAAYVFGLLPAVVHDLLPPALDRMGLDWLRLGAVYLGLLGCVQLAFWLAHRRLHPEQRAGRWGRLAAMLLSPADAMASPQRLGVDLLAGLHPLAVLRALGTEAEFRALAGRLLRGLRHPVAAHRASAEAADAVEGFLRAEGIDVTDLLAPPPPRDDSRSWCPRCHEQFTTAPGACAGCAGVMRLPYA